MIRTATCLLFVLAAGCSSDETTVRPAAAATQTTSTAEMPTPASGPATSRVVVSPEIAKACNMPTPHFDFDSSNLGAQRSLDTLATCFISGPMKGRAVHLVGRADPRGTEDYNIALGQRRAGSVEEYLVARGLGKDKVTSMSRGAMDATGSDDSSWAEDRRVDILLGD